MRSRCAVHVPGDGAHSFTHRSTTVQVLALRCAKTPRCNARKRLSVPVASSSRAPVGGVGARSRSVICDVDVCRAIMIVHALRCALAQRRSCTLTSVRSGAQPWSCARRERVRQQHRKGLYRRQVSCACMGAHCPQCQRASCRRLLPQRSTTAETVRVPASKLATVRIHL